MNSGFACPSDSRWPRPFLASRRQARVIYLLCLVASFASMLLLAYSSTATFSKHLVANGEGNIADGNVAGVRAALLSNSSVHTSSPPVNSGRGGKSVIKYGSITNSNFQAPVFYNCSAIDTSSELLSMKVPQYHPNFKNPCWYEDLSDHSVYSNNKFADYFHNYRNVFQTLTQIWKTKLELESNPRRLRCLPYFFIAGQPKCGSTDLYKKVSSHPDVVSPPIKESHWWGKNRYGWRSNYTTSLSFTDYVDLYDKVALNIDQSVTEDGYHSLVTGDGSVSTLWDNDEWWRLKENCGGKEPKFTNADYVHHFLPDSKIIIILRDPVDRLWSDYLYFQRVSKSADDFHRNAVNAISVHVNCTKTNTLQHCIYNRTLANLVRVRLRIGIYYAYIENWLNIFPRDQFLIVRLEDYTVNVKSVLRTIYRFMNLRDLTRAEEEFIMKQPVANARRKGDKKFGKMREDTRKLLEDFYYPYNKRLALLLNDNKFMWKDKNRTSASPQQQQNAQMNSKERGVRSVRNRKFGARGARSRDMKVSKRTKKSKCFS